MQYIVQGGHRLAGRIRPSGNKNAALPIVAAALLCDEPVHLTNVPRIKDVETLVELLQSVGASAEWTSRNALTIHAKSVRVAELDPALCRKISASILLAGPLLGALRRAHSPAAGWRRHRAPPRRHTLPRAAAARRNIRGRQRLRAQGEKAQGRRRLSRRAKRHRNENALAAAVAAEGTTVLRNAASEPHVQDLAHFLVAMGASIDGIGTNTITIHGGRPLHGCTHEIGPDHIEVGSFIGLAAVTRSEITIERAGVEHLRSTLMGFERLGVVCRIEGDDLVIPADQEMVIRSDLGGAVPKLEDQPWPAFPADTMSIALVTATQCTGVIVIHEKMFESRLFFVDKLIGMGARIVLCDPHRAVVVGPSQLHSGRVESPDIRAGMAMLLAALCAQGESTIDNVGQIERGYERIDERLRALGAQIERVEDRRTK